MARSTPFHPQPGRDAFRDILVFEERLKQNAERYVLAPNTAKAPVAYAPRLFADSRSNAASMKVSASTRARSWETGRAPRAESDDRGRAAQLQAPVGAEDEARGQVVRSRKGERALLTPGFHRMQRSCSRSSASSSTSPTPCS